MEETFYPNLLEIYIIPQSSLKGFLAFVRPLNLNHFIKKILWQRLVIRDLYLCSDYLRSSKYFHQFENLLYTYQLSFCKKHGNNYFGNNFSQPASVSCGVPQGFISGILLLLVIVNDMSQAVKYHIFLHANDSFLVCEHKGINEIKNS